MYKKLSLSAILLLLPMVTFAQNFQTFLGNLITFLSGIVIPFLFGIAFLFFVINAIRYFVLGGNNIDGQAQAKALALYGISAFVFLIIFWGIINMLTSSIGLDSTLPSETHSDYVTRGGSLPPDCSSPPC